LAEHTNFQSFSSKWHVYDVWIICSSCAINNLKCSRTLCTRCMYNICSVSIILCTPVHVFVSLLTPFFSVPHSLYQTLAQFSEAENRETWSYQWEIHCTPVVLSLIRLELNAYTLVCLPAVLCVQNMESRFHFRRATTKQALSVEVEALCSLRAACRLNLPLFCLQFINIILSCV
jgi:hypothetical protein